MQDFSVDNSLDETNEISPEQDTFSGMLCCTAGASVGPAPEMSTLWSQSLTSAMRWQTPPVGDQLVLPRICKGWSTTRLNSCNGSGKTSRVTNQIQKSEDAVILQCCGLYSSLGALNIQSLQVKSCFV